MHQHLRHRVNANRDREHMTALSEFNDLNHEFALTRLLSPIEFENRKPTIVA